MVAKAKLQSEPPEGGWDDAPTATSLPDDSDPVTPQRLPPVVVNEPAPQSVTKPMSVPPVARPASVPPPRMASTPPPPVVRAASVPPAPVTPVSLPQGLSASMREEVWAIVRAAVEEGIKPALAKQKELEARLAAAEAAAKARPAPAPAAAPAPAPQQPQVRMASIPVATSIAPSAPPPARPGSIPPTGYGVSVVRASRPEIDLAAIAKIPVEMDGAFDGGRRKRRLGKIVIGLLLAGVLTVIVLAILSQNGV